MVVYQNAYDSLAEFMADLDPVKVLGFHAPAKTQERVEDLLEKKTRTWAFSNGTRGTRPLFDFGTHCSISKITG